MNFIILPHQLFNYTFLNKNYNIFLWEHPHYFTKYSYNKKKLMLHRASMKLYFTQLKAKKFNVKYVEFNKELDRRKKYIMFDPIDNVKSLNNYDLTFLETPNFLLSKNCYEMYREKTSHFIFNNFYKWGKKILKIIPNIKSQDKKNRKSLPKKIKIPPTCQIHTSNEITSLHEAAIYVEKYFSKNPGNTKNFLYPISHKTAKRWLNLWIKNKFNNFGPFQDAIGADSFLFHSTLSSSINIGLINPLEIITIIKTHKSGILLNSYEGYIRQLFWREYQRYCYIYYNFNNKNYFNNRKKLTKKWYTGNIGIEPIDSCIIRGFNNAYLNHIERLMVIGNYMVLSGISPKQGFKWFMEMSCDSYEWVMTQNVLDMVFFVSGGVTMRRPYISSSNYIIKMGKLSKKNNNWCRVWDNLYNEFKKKHKSKLWKFRYFFPGL